MRLINRSKIILCRVLWFEQTDIDLQLQEDVGTDVEDVDVVLIDDDDDHDGISKLGGKLGDW